MKKILLPTDFSKASLNAINYAVQLFKNQDCTFYVLNTYAPVAIYTAAAYNDDPALNNDIEAIFRKKSIEKVQEIIDIIKTDFPDTKHQFKGISTFNILSLEVEELTKEHQLDLVIMGTTGASGLKEVFIGSQTMHVIKGAKIPVIGVPVAYDFTSPKTVVFATDYKTNTHQVGFSLLEELCSLNKSRLILLNAYYGESLDKKQLKNKEALESYFKHEAPLTLVVKGMDVLEAIEDFQSKHRIHLLALVHNKHNFFENLLFRPVIQKIVHHSNVPFLILPAHN